MKAFIRHITGLFLATLLIMMALDYSYTKVYNSAAPRTKFQMLKKWKAKSINYVFLGSSRVDNGIVPSIIEEKTGKTAMNLGFQGSKLNDIYTVLQLLKAYHIKSEKVFIQIDYIFNIDGRSNMLPYEMAPFVKDNPQTKEYFRSFPDFKEMYCVPFYRYCAFDHKIGVREILLNLAGKKTNVIKDKGYSPLQGNAVDSDYQLPAKIRDRNETYESIRNFCLANKIDVVFYCAPFWKQSKNLDYIAKLKTRIPDLKDYSAAITDSTMFKNDFHLNDTGARFFTEKLTDDLLLKK